MRFLNWPFLYWLKLVYRLAMARLVRRPVRHRLVLAILFIGLLLGLALWLLDKPPPQVLTAEVTRSDLEQAVWATGVMQARQQVDVGAQVSGQLLSLSVMEGQHVESGQLLAEIDPEISRNELKVAGAALEGMVAQRRAKQASLAQAQRELLRQRQMVQQHASSAKALLEAKTHYEVLRAELDYLQAQVRQHQFSVDKHRTNLRFTRIRAPMRGEVVDIVTKVGQTIIATQQAPIILKIADLSQMTVKTQVSEADVIRIKPGLPVYFTVLGAPERRFEGKVRTILPTPETINGTVFYKALFEVPNSDGMLRVNMTAQVNIVLAKVNNVLSIPLSALGARQRSGWYRVKVQDAAGKISERVVRTGLKTESRIQVLQGLKLGEKVVTSMLPEDDQSVAARTGDTAVVS